MFVVVHVGWCTTSVNGSQRNTNACELLHDLLFVREAAEGVYLEPRD
jgi:hypothetical protein